MTFIFGYIRTSRRLQEGVPGMDPAFQELQLRRAGVPLNCVHRDVGVSGTTGTQGGGAGIGSTAALPAATPWWCRHLPHRPALAGHHQVHLRAARPRCEGPLPGRCREGVDPLPGGRRRESRSVLRPDPHDVRGVGRGPGAGIRQAEDPGGDGTSPPAGEDLGPAQKTPSRAGGGDPKDAGRTRQPPAYRRILRVLGQHRPADVATGQGGLNERDERTQRCVSDVNW